MPRLGCARELPAVTNYNDELVLVIAGDNMEKKGTLVLDIDYFEFATGEW